MFGSGLECYMGERGRWRRFEDGENINKHGFVNGDVNFFVTYKLERDPEEVGDFLGYG